MLRSIAVGILCCCATVSYAQEIGTYDQSKKAVERLQKLRESIPARFKEENQHLVLSETYNACAQLYSEDKTSALLNPTCNSVFLTLHHPSMKNFSEFTYTAIKDEYREISDEDKKDFSTLGFGELYELLAE